MALIYHGHGQTRVRAVAWAPDGRRVASASRRETLYLAGGFTTGELLERQEIKQYLARAHPNIAIDKNLVQTTRAFQQIMEWDGAREQTESAQVWNSVSGETLACYHGHPHGATHIAWSLDGNRILSAGGYDGSAQVWEATNGRQIARYQDEVRSQRAAERLRRAAAEPSDVRRSHLLKSAGDEQWAQAATWAASDARIIATCANEVYVWDVASGRRLVTYGVHRSRVNALTIAPDGSQAASADAWLVHIWDAERRGSTLRFYRGHERGAVFAVAWSPDGTRIASGGQGDVHVWDPHDGQTVCVFRAHRPYGIWHALAWSPDSVRLVSGGRDRKLHVWDARTGEITQTYTGHAALVTAAAWSPDGARIASADRIGEIHVWDVE